MATFRSSSRGETEGTTAFLSVSRVASRDWRAESYGSIPEIACWAFRSFAEETSFIAEVIFSVLRTDPIRPFVSFNDGIIYIPRITLAASFSIIAVISSDIFPSESGASTSSAWAALILSRKWSWNSLTFPRGISFIRAWVPQ